MVERVYGKANGTDVIFSRASNATWEIAVPWEDDGKYTAEIFAEDEAGNTSHLCTMLFVISGHELQACIVLDDEKQVSVDEKKYYVEVRECNKTIEIQEGGYQVERIICGTTGTV
ncbi:PF13754 domain-containing protein [Blautia sp. MSJ-19]|uniref:PF13754 domain-containing protein n=1 Tax=Blautia sp. MSJ-19 TaxID=2841517 RepID=UPI001C0F3A29|nr:PF13754 domain-containing protein [Blautia sp. MSJ-19]MBU5480880.1 Ig-like domain repeat protein [Blautia sp. MSJ-19]